MLCLAVGFRVTVSELDDGTVRVRHAGKVLPMGRTYLWTFARKSR